MKKNIFTKRIYSLSEELLNFAWGGSFLVIPGYIDRLFYGGRK